MAPLLSLVHILLFFVFNLHLWSLTLFAIATSAVFDTTVNMLNQRL